MNEREFCFWLQGQFELNPENALSPEQVEVIRAHLDGVFAHEVKVYVPMKTPNEPSETALEYFTLPTSVLHQPIC